MKNLTILTVLLLAMTSFPCSGQSFLSKYPKLTKQDLSEFFKDWKAYSDSIALTVAGGDSLISEIVNSNYLTMSPDAGKSRNGKATARQFVVAPQYIRVYRYDMECDTSSNGLRYGPCMSYSEPHSIDTITPRLPDTGLYLTNDIERALSVFAGGVKIDGSNEISDINKDAVRALEKYIPVDYGHWGGYWWFTSFPMITGIQASNNLISANRRTSWCTGDEIWYVKENGRFVKRPEPVDGWIE